ncbi:Permease (fragment) [Candidatus Desulfosporosinus infrequens]|uniref:Permease n=1 Tax=Candidatus Desulfosporosinus infrequens TaxID=2043169 RepID=A0A2U3LLZ5_9FIRM
MARNNHCGLIPGVVTFPLAAALLKSGASFTAIVVFVSTSMMVGVVTYPVKARYFRHRAAIVRNTLALLFSFVVAIILGRILK